MRMCSRAPWHPRPGRNPYATCQNPASKLSSNLLEEECFLPVASDASHCHPINARRSLAFVAGDASPGAPQVAQVGDPVPQLTVVVVGVFPTPLVQLPLHVEHPDLIGPLVRVHRPLLRLQKRTVFLSPFAMCAAFPRSDYYGGSVLPRTRPRSPRVARLRDGRARGSSHVPARNL